MSYDIIKYSAYTIDRLSNDRETFEMVVKEKTIVGKLGFAMIATAMAAFDVYAWILYQKFNNSVRTDKLFNLLLNDKNNFFDKIKYGNEKAFYSLVRCGVLHQLYPKNANIVAIDSEIIWYKFENKRVVNSYALFCDILSGIKKIHTYIEGLPSNEKMDLSLKLLMRKKMDEEESQGAEINIESLPELLPKVTTSSDVQIITTATTTGL
jgi:hypothetical protein